MASPVVASGIAGYRDVVREGCGMLVSPGDSAAPADALDAVLTDAGLRAGLRAKARRAAAPFHWDIVAERIDAEYRWAVIDHSARWAERRHPGADEDPHARAAAD